MQREPRQIHPPLAHQTLLGTHVMCVCRCNFTSLDLPAACAIRRVTQQRMPMRASLCIDSVRIHTCVLRACVCIPRGPMSQCSLGQSPYSAHYDQLRTIEKMRTRSAEFDMNCEQNASRSTRPTAMRSQWSSRARMWTDLRLSRNFGHPFDPRNNRESQRTRWLRTRVLAVAHYPAIANHGYFAWVICSGDSRRVVDKRDGN